MFAFRVSILVFILIPLSSVIGAPELRDFSVIEKKNPKDPDGPSWLLKTKNQELGLLESIGGAPILLQLKAVKVDGMTLYELRYDAGSMGTRTLAQLERIAILQNTKNNTWTKHLDFLVKVIHRKGSTILFKEERPYQWKKGRLELGYIEDESEKNYRWTGMSLVQTK